MMDAEEHRKHVKRLLNDKRAFEQTLAGSYCALCGQEYPPQIVQYHHIGGRVNSDEELPLCYNCHVMQTLRQTNWPEGWSSVNNPPRVKSAFLIRGLADLIMFIAKTLRKLSDEMLEEERKNGKS
jgi:hypothetical protein